ncbi:probably inactive leucine-rich repeat receptor-like protein kinase At5g48380 [Triticum aestivum]|uniref:probably inactive leucine-rich repeat receptor-like protein kinase At5g48380 n=1 Tax=Triticum aestivum TaxID=4565 RepID=UPI001D02E061|nr:probably inactive leucine-rich repeat receptor-like protein kinase At5g48380 [Triticum aestivum]
MTYHIKFLLLFLLFRSSSSCFGFQLDIQCLLSVQESVIDSKGILMSSWDFVANTTDGYICRFTGVECWHPDENKVYALRLGNLGLEGPFPQGLQNCTSLNMLDLSSNNFSGPIPPNISWQLSYLSSLDLSFNKFSGEIPDSIANLMNLNGLNFQHNQLSGRIPASLQKFIDSYFAGNQELCGTPLYKCPRRRWRPRRIRLTSINDQSSIGAAVGFVVGFVVAFYFPHCFIFSERLRVCLVGCMKGA